MTAASSSPTEKTRVLVVDDSRVMRRAIAKILQDDADLIEAEHGEDGWEKLTANERVQVLVTDIEMPVLDGYQLICRIRASDDPRIRNLPIITITGAEDEETKTRAFACGATDFIVKPLDKLQLQARVQAHAKLDDTTRQLAATSATLEEEATSDPLTGLMSRRYFNQRGEQDIAHAQRHGSALSMMRIDIDGFKKLYQTHGDDGADRILKVVANALKSTARTEDTVARIGGAEFSILAPATDKTKAAVLAERLRVAIASQTLQLDSGTVPLTISIGVVSMGEDGSDLETLSELADNRLRHAKAEGGNTVSAAARNEAAATEEVTLDAAPLPDDVQESDTGGLELVEELADLSAAGAEPAVAVATPQSAAGKPAQLASDLIGLDRALSLLIRGQGEKLSPHILELALRVLPLLEFCDRSLRLNLGRDLDTLKEKLFSAK